MKIKQLFIIDPIDKLHIEKDTSFLIINESIKRGHDVSISYEEHLSLLNGVLKTKVFNLDFPVKEEGFTPDFSQTEVLSNFDIVHIRKDPPYDSNYLALSLLMKHAEKTLVVNRPEALLKFNEKESIFYFPELITDTLISSDVKEILSFTKSVGGNSVLKPLFNCSGKGVTKLDLSDGATIERIEVSTSMGTEKVMVQKFLEKIHEGETRVFMLEDKPLAVMKKKPKEGSFLGNFDFGATAIKYSLNEAEKKLCKRVGEFAKNEGIYFSALDIIDGCLSEFNITSPGLLCETNAIDNCHYEKQIVDFLEKKIKVRKG
jgi:glutathione synthase